MNYIHPTRRILFTAYSRSIAVDGARISRSIKCHHAPLVFHWADATSSKIFLPAACRWMSTKRARAEERWALPYETSLRSAKDYLREIRRAPSSMAAKRIMEEMERKGIQQNAYHYSALINRFGKEGRWKTSLGLLREMDRKGVRPNVVCCLLAIAACERGGRWREALNVLRDMGRIGVKLDVKCFNTALTACGKCGKWKEALCLLEKDMPKMGVTPDVDSYIGVISACEKNGQLRKALDLFRDMRQLGIEPDLYVYQVVNSALIKRGELEKADEIWREMRELGIEENVKSYTERMKVACDEQVGQWQYAIDLFRDMDNQGIEPDAMSFATVITAHAKCGNWMMAVELLQKMVDRGIEAHAVCFNATIEACFNSHEYFTAADVMRKGQMKGFYPVFESRAKTWDLHGFSFAVSCLLLSDALATFVRRGLHLRPSFEEIIVVTGKGRGSGPSGPVLQSKMPKFISHHHGPSTKKVRGNSGCFAITAETFKAWEESPEFAAFVKTFINT